MSAKRANLFSQGRPENPYEDRDGPPDPPQRATAAQMAARKIKNVKPRRIPGSSSALSQSANFGSTLQTTAFGSNTPSENATSSFSATFGPSATNSFPPAQPAAPSANFANASFPAFGASAQGAASTPQPPSSSNFNFNMGSSNMFAASAPAPASALPANGNPSAPAFGGGASLFGAPSQSSLFGSLGQSTTSAAPQTSLFNTVSTAPQTTVFGTASPTPTATTSTPFTFGSPAPAAPSTTTPSTSSMFNGFGTSTQTAPAPSNNLFNFSSNAPKTDPPAQPAPNNLFAASTVTNAPAFNNPAAATTTQSSSLFNFGSTAPKSNIAAPALFGASSAATPTTSMSASTPAPSNPFTFGSIAPKSDTAPQTLFATSGPSTQGINTPSSAPASNLFGSLSGAPTSTPKASDANPLLSGLTPVKQSEGTSTEPPPANPFASLKKLADTPAATPVGPPSFSLFGSNPTPKAPETASQFSNSTPHKLPENASTNTPQANPFASLQKPSGTPAAAPAGLQSFDFSARSQQKSPPSEEPKKLSNAVQPPAAPPSNRLNAFSTPQPQRTADAQLISAGGLCNTDRPRVGTGIFAECSLPSKGEGSFREPGPKTAGFATESPKYGQATATPIDTLSNQPAPAPAIERPNLFSAPKQAPTASSISQMSAFKGVAEASQEQELPKVSKVHVPKEWAQPGSVVTQGAHGLYQQISDLTAQLQALNERYRQQLGALPPTADWSAISHWHYQHALDIKKKIDNAKKQRATAKGITGNETSLSTKRKVDEESHERRNLSPVKRARSDDAPTTPTPQPTAPTPTLQANAISTSSIFAKAINGTKASSTNSVESNHSPSKAGENDPVLSAKPAPPASGFTPSFPVPKGTGTTADAALSSSGFKPNFGSMPTSGFKPASGTSSGSGSFMAQFKKTAKTYEELAAERKAKVMAEDFDSDDETEEEWSARYDKEEAERLAEEKKKVATNTPTFSITAPTKPSNSNPSMASNPFVASKSPAGAGPAPNTFTTRASSPALSTGSQSVLDSPSNAPVSSNIFGHLSSGTSTNQDDSDDDETAHATAQPTADEAVGSTKPETTPKGKFGEHVTQDDDASQENTSHKKQNNGASSKGSLLSRMTRADPGDTTSGKNISTVTDSGQSDDTQSPTTKPFTFFDFVSASSPSAGPKTDSFAGDQTFKPGTPIKFGEASATEKNSAPLFQFQPATPAPSGSTNTPAKPAPASLFSFTPSGGGSSLLAPSTGSMSSSVFSSRAATPLSEVDTNASAGENDDEDGGKDVQIDLSQLTEEEVKANDVVFHTDVVLAKHQVEDGGQMTWANLAKGPLWILKDKTTAKCFVRLRIASGATPLNYLILPSLRAIVKGASKKMVSATRPAKEGGLQSMLFCLRTPELADEFATKYNDSLPSN